MLTKARVLTLFSALAFIGLAPARGFSRTASQPINVGNVTLTCFRDPYGTTARWGFITDDGVTDYELRLEIVGAGERPFVRSSPTDPLEIDGGQWLVPGRFALTSRLSGRVIQSGAGAQSIGLFVVCS
ncbi:hypothetical protein [Phormidesmis sp. 146-33]